jgi:hypothetical protein
VIWLTLLKRFWLPLTVATLLIGAAMLLRHQGYESGFAASEVKWRPRFETAERELAAANARTEKTEADSKALSAESQRRIDETLQTLHVRATDYDSRLRALSMRVAARASCQSLPAVPGGLAATDAATESEQRAAQAGSRIAGIGADCESDAARLSEWQRWYTEQQAVMR